MLKQTQPDVVVLCETRADAQESLSRMWPGSKTEQIVQRKANGGTTRAGVSVTVRQGLEATIGQIYEEESQDRKELVQVVKVRVNGNKSVVGTYISPMVNGGRLETTLDKISPRIEERDIIVGDLNARHRLWDSKTNSRGKALVKWAQQRNLNISATQKPSCSAKGRLGQSFPDLLLDKEAAEVVQPSSEKWDNSSDHTPILYLVRGVNTIHTKGRLSKTMLNNPKNQEEAGEVYRATLEPVIEGLKRANEADAKEHYETTRKAILKPWIDMVDRRPKAKKQRR